MYIQMRSDREINRQDKQYIQTDIVRGREVDRQTNRHRDREIEEKIERERQRKEKRNGKHKNRNKRKNVQHKWLIAFSI